MLLTLSKVTPTVRAAINLGLSAHTGFILPHSCDIRDVAYFLDVRVGMRF